LISSIQQNIIQILENRGWVAFLTIFWTGAVLSFSSCTIVRVPIVMSYVSGASDSKKRAILLTFSFVAALILSYTFLGIIFGFVSSLLTTMIKWNRYFCYLMGTIAFILGINMAGLVDFGLFKNKQCNMQNFQKKGLLGAFLFGLIFAVFEAPTCPCCGPVLFMIASFIFKKGNLLYAVLLCLSYALGQSFPILLVGSFTSIVKYINPKAERIEEVVKMIGGNVLIALALYFFLIG